VLMGRVFGDGLYVFVTGVAQLRSFVLDQPGIVGTMGVMAADTVVFRRLMNELELCQLFLCCDVAGKAKPGSVHGQELVMVGAVRIVTDRTLSHCRGAVHILHV